MLKCDDIKVIGVTGGIGSGKSTVAEILADFGGVLIDADKVAKALMKPGQKAYAAVVEYFGTGILKRDDGEIDTKVLGQIVFSDKQKLKKLNDLTHKIVGSEIKRNVDEIKSAMYAKPLEKGDLRFIILDVPIPVEEGFFDIANTIWVVIANDDIRVERIVKRNGIGEDEAERKIKSQMTNGEYLAIADVVIENETDIELLRKSVATELLEYLKMEQ